MQAATVQAPDAHPATAWEMAQIVPHAPQLFTSAATWTSQPSETWPLQLAQPGPQIAPQWPAEQLAAPLAGWGQAVWQFPQWARSVSGSVQLPEQESWEGPQTQAPSEQSWLLGQVRPQAPQLVTSELRWISQPSVLLWLQSA
jgi:hypothetical protein